MYMKRLNKNKKSNSNNRISNKQEKTTKAQNMRAAESEIIDGRENVNSRVNFRKKPVSAQAVGDSFRDLITNDPEFYNHTPELVTISGSISFLTRAGEAITLNTNSTASPVSTVPPGIMAMDIVTGPGWSADGSSPVSIAATDIYSFVRHENSGAKNYDPVDIMLYILAMDEAYMWFEYAKRAYGAAFLYSSMNEYVPMPLLTAMGWNAGDVVANLAQFNAYLNIAVGKLNSLNVPQQYSLIERHRRLYRGVFMDTQSGKSQIYVMRPLIRRTFTETEGPGALDAVLNGTGLTVNAWFNAFNNMIDAIRNSEDCGTMSGDILKAYGSANMITVETVPITYGLEVTPDITLLRQFKNANPLNGLITTTTVPDLDIKQVAGINGYLVFKPRLLLNTAEAPTGAAEAVTLSTYDQIVDMSVDATTPMDVIEATRLKCQATYTGQVTVGSKTYNEYQLQSIGSEFVANCWIFTLNGPNVVPTQFKVAVYSGGSNLDLQSALISRMFDYRPIQYWLGSGLVNNTLNTVQPCSEMNVYAVLPAATLKQLHDVAILSEFSIPIR